MTRFEYQFPQVRFLPSVTAAASSTRSGKLPSQLRRPVERGGPAGRVHPHSTDVHDTETSTYSTTPSDAPDPGRSDVVEQREQRNDLDYLTDEDRNLIHAVTGEVIAPGQRPQDQPLSAFAMQLAVDRKSGGLRAGLEVTGAYLRRTNKLLLQLNVPCNPFSGELLERALRYVDRKTGGHLNTGSIAVVNPATPLVRDDRKVGRQPGFSNQTADNDPDSPQPPESIAKPTGS